MFLLFTIPSRLKSCVVTSVIRFTLNLFKREKNKFSIQQLYFSEYMTSTRLAVIIDQALWKRKHPHTYYVIIWIIKYSYLSINLISSPTAKTVQALATKGKDLRSDRDGRRTVWFSRIISVSKVRAPAWWALPSDTGT